MIKKLKILSCLCVIFMNEGFCKANIKQEAPDYIYANFFKEDNKLDKLAKDALKYISDKTVAIYDANQIDSVTFLKNEIKQYKIDQIISNALLEMVEITLKFIDNKQPKKKNQNSSKNNNNEVNNTNYRDQDSVSLEEISEQPHKLSDTREMQNSLTQSNTRPGNKFKLKKIEDLKKRIAKLKNTPEQTS